MAEGTGEKTIRDPNEQRSLLGLVYGFSDFLLYADAIRRNLRTTLEGFLVGGHAHRTDTVVDAQVTDTPVNLQVDVSEDGVYMLAITNDMNEAVTLDLVGVTGGQGFILENALVIAGGGGQFIETYTDPWLFLDVTLTGPAVPTGGDVVAEVLRRT